MIFQVLQQFVAVELSHIPRSAGVSKEHAVDEDSLVLPVHDTANGALFEDHHILG